MEQAEAVWSGTHIGTRPDANFDILLYQVDGFYVEVYYEREHNTITRLRSFSSVNQLEPYLGQIDIKGLTD